MAPLQLVGIPGKGAVLLGYGKYGCGLGFKARRRTVMPTAAAAVNIIASPLRQTGETIKHRTANICLILSTARNWTNPFPIVSDKRGFGTSTPQDDFRAAYYFYSKHDNSDLVTGRNWTNPFPIVGRKRNFGTSALKDDFRAAYYCHSKQDNSDLAAARFGTNPFSVVTSKRGFGTSTPQDDFRAAYYQYFPSNQDHSDPATMKEATVKKDLSVEIVDSPIPKPGLDQVVIKVVVSGSNPKDWKMPQLMGMEMNSGDDIAGYVHSVGPDVYEFKAGDKVAAFHEMRTPGGSFAEYAVAWQHTTFHLPEKTTFEEAATLPLAAMTAAVGVFVRMGLPEPWSPQKLADGQKVPILVYGAASAVGAYAIQFARLANLRPIIGVAGRGIPFAESLIDKSKGDTIVDYRNGDEAVVNGIKDALKASGLSYVKYVFDAVSEKGSHENIAAVIDPNGGQVTHVLPVERFARTKGFKYPHGVKPSQTMVGSVHNADKDFGFIWFRYFSRLLADGRLKPHPHEVIPGGLGGVREGLLNLNQGKASATKYVFRVGETEGAGEDG